MMNDQLRKIETELYNLLSPELREITEIVTETRKEDSQYLVALPTSTVDLPMEELSSLVARTGSAYGRIARFAGIAEAQYKLAKGRFDRKYKQNQVGNNPAERTKNASEASEDEHAEMVVAEAIRSLAASFEKAAKNASESARKIFDKAEAMQIGQAREDHGKFREGDFRPY